MKTDNPVYFFVAHVQIKYNMAKSQLKNFAGLFPETAKVEMIRATPDSLHVTYVATFPEPLDYISIKNKLSYFYGGKSKIFAVHHSTTDQPSYFYSVFLKTNFSSHEKINGTLEQKHKLFKAVLALITPLRTQDINYHHISVLVLSPDKNIRDEDITTIKNSLLGMPHTAFLSSQKETEE